MQFFTLIISALAATALAAPTEPKPTTTMVAHPPAQTTTMATHPPAQTTTSPHQPGGGSYDPCTGLSIGYTPQCCAVNLLGLISLDCKPPSTFPTSAQDFQTSCKYMGAKPQCCVVNALNQGLVCQSPSGTH